MPRRRGGSPDALMREEAPPALAIGLGALRFAAYAALAVLVAEAAAGERSVMPVRLLIAIVIVVAVARAGIGYLIAGRRRKSHPEA